AATALGFLPWLSSFANQATHAGHAPVDLAALLHTPLDALSLPIVLGRLLMAGTFLPPPAGLLSGVVIGWALVLVAVALLSRRPGPFGGGLRVGTGTALPVLVTVPAAAMGGAALVSARSDLLQARCIQ